MRREAGGTYSEADDDSRKCLPIYHFLDPIPQLRVSPMKLLAHLKGTNGIGDNSSWCRGIMI